MGHAAPDDKDCKIPLYKNRIYSHKNGYYAFQSMEYVFPSKHFLIFVFCISHMMEQSDSLRLRCNMFFLAEFSYFPVFFKNSSRACAFRK